MDILSIDSLSDSDVAGILDTAELYFSGNRGRRASERLHGRIVFNVFYENSTRTAMSFATAAHRLGASAIALSSCPWTYRRARTCSTRPQPSTTRPTT